MTRMIKLCMHGQCKAGDGRHPQQVMKDLGINYLYAVPQSIADCWMFFGVHPDAAVDLAYLESREVDPMQFVGWGLSEDMALELIKKGMK